jgi:hypothetical protein
MDASEMILVAGWGDTRRTLARWNLSPWGVLQPWTLGAALISITLLVAVWCVASLSTPDTTPLLFPGLNAPAGAADVGHVLYRNSLVLALHSMACVAGYIAGASLPREARRHTGIVRAIHEHAGPLAILFVSGATLFSLSTQAYILGSGASTLAAQGGVSPGLLLVGLTPHALPELVALFLPLAAWLRASRRGAWNELLAATFVTTAIAAPVLILAALVEVYVSPHFILWLQSLHFV